MVSRNEIRAGVLVLISIVVLGGGLITLAGSASLFSSTRSVTAVLRNARGVRSGDPVRFAGFEVGEVEDLAVRQSSVEDEETGAVRRVYRVVVTLQVPTDLDIPADSGVQVTETLTGSRIVEIVPGEGDLLVEGEELANDVTPASLGEISGRFDGLVAKVESTIEEAGGLFGEAKGLVSKVEQALEGDRVRSILENVKNASASIADTAADLKKRMEGMGPDLTAAAKSVREAGQEASALIKDVRPDVKKAIESVRVAAEGVAKLTKDDEAPLPRTLAKIETAAESLDGVLGEFKATGSEAKGLLTDSRPKVEAILERLRATGANLKAASEDLRAHPWKLLNAPDEADQRVQGLFHAARNFNTGAEDLVDAVRDLRAALAREGVVAKDLAPLLESLDRSFRGYAEAETLFWKALRSGGK